MFTKKWTYFLLVSLCIVSFPVHSSGQDVPVYSMDNCIQMALKFSPQVKELQQEVEMSKTRLDEAKGYQLPQIEVTAISGPSPKARGNQIESNYRNDEINGIGIFGNLELKVVEPIYTFGKITEGKKAATHGIHVDESRVKQKATDVALEIKKYYYGYLASIEGNKLVNEIDGYLNTSIDRTKKLLDSEAGKATEIDLQKLEAYKGLLAKYHEETAKNIIMSKEAIRTFIGLEKGSEFELKDKSLETPDFAVENLEFYIGKSKDLRPEFIQLKEGLEAKRALVNVADADLYPMFFAAGYYSYADASERDKVTNPWIYDYFRHNLGGVVVGLKWHFDFGITKSKVRMAEADYKKYENLREYANIGIPLQVEKTYREFMEEKKNVVSLKNASQQARKWMIGAVMNYDMGIGESQDVADAVAAYGKIAEEYITSLYNYNMNYANLIQTSGLSVKEISDKY